MKDRLTLTPATAEAQEVIYRYLWEIRLVTDVIRIMKSLFADMTAPIKSYGGSSALGRTTITQKSYPFIEG